MTVSNESYLSESLDSVMALGDKDINSDAFMVIDGYEQERFLFKQFPWPVLTPEGNVEVPMPMGLKHHQPAQINIAQEGAVTMMETKAGHIKAMLHAINEQGGRFNARVYRGTYENPSDTARITLAFLRVEPMDRDIENRTQVSMWSGTMYYHYVGKA